MSGPVLPPELVESERIVDLRRRSEEVRAMLADLAGSQHLRPLVGLGALVDHLEQMAPNAERSVWVLQPRYFYDPEDPGVQLSHAAQARGTQTLLLTRPHTLDTHPLLSSIYPSTRLAPVFLRAMVIDEEHLTIEAPDTTDGERSSWVTQHPEILEAVLEIWHRTVAVSAPVLAPGTQPPLSRRQLEVARLLAVGEKDVSIARLLEMSARTVERDVQMILRELGAGSRTEAVLAMRGRGVNGGGIRARQS